VSIFAVAFAVRLLHVMQIRSAPFFTVLMGDSHGYDEWAQRIAGGEWLGREVFYQAPLYPYLLGSIYAIAGRHLLLVRIVQIVIGSASSRGCCWRCTHQRSSSTASSRSRCSTCSSCASRCG
jgi:hypothetical protein